MDKAKAIKLGNEVKEFLKGKYPELKIATRGTFSPNNLNLKVEILETDVKAPSEEFTQDDIENGMAMPGTILTHRGKDVVIVKVKRVKYIFYYAGDPDNLYTARFSAFLVK